MIGDSTVKNGRGDGARGQWGWGQVLQARFDSAKLEVENRALGGRSSRTYLTEGLWEESLERLRPGDFLLIQFGHNDGGQKFEGNRPRASIKGNGDESEEGVVEMTGKAETVYSFGWYLRRYCEEAKQRGATPIVLSLVPRDIWEDDRVIRADKDYGEWAREAAEQSGALFIDLNGLVAARYESDGRDKVHAEYFTEADHTHTSQAGAEVNADCVVAGIRSLEECPLKDYLLPEKGTEVLLQFGGKADGGFTLVDDAAPYVDLVGYGFEGETDAVEVDHEGAHGDSPFSFSIRVPEGNHRVAVTMKGGAGGADTGVEAELRRVIFDLSPVAAGESHILEMIINTRTPTLPHGKRVRLKEREKTTEAAAWDNKLTLRFTGEKPRVSRIEVQANVEVPTLYLLGDSTVCDQPAEPWASWGQKLTRYFGSTVAVANHAESGESIRGAYNAGRCDKLLELLRPGDWLMVQFGHNDMKDKSPDALQTYRDNLAKLIGGVRERGATPVLVTSMERMKGLEDDTLGDYPQTVRDLGAELGVAVIDLHAMSKLVYQSLGERLGEAFQDGTHHTDLGADLLAACIADGVRMSAPGLAEHLNDAKPVRP